jgi:hypothetical protein
MTSKVWILQIFMRNDFIISSASIKSLISHLKD